MGFHGISPFFNGELFTGIVLGEVLRVLEPDKNTQEISQKHPPGIKPW